MEMFSTKIFANLQHDADCEHACSILHLFAIAKFQATNSKHVFLSCVYCKVTKHGSGSCYAPHNQLNFKCNYIFCQLLVTIRRIVWFMMVSSHHNLFRAISVLGNPKHLNSLMCDYLMDSYISWTVSFLPVILFVSTLQILGIAYK